MQQSFSSLLKVFQCPHVFYKKKWNWHGMTLLSFMFLILKTNKALSCFTRLISLHIFFNSLNGKSACF